MHCPVGSLGVLIALGTLGLVAPSALATTTTIYKCFDHHLSLVYTDAPCKEGERMDVDAGDANPVAVAKLEHARDMLDLAAAERIADERHAALERGLAAATPRRHAEDERAPGDYAASSALYDPGYAVYPTLPLRSMRPRMRHADLRRFAPNHPHHAPRQQRAL